MIRWKALPWLVGVALLAVSLVAALRSADTPVTPGGAGKVAAPPPVPVGPTFVGTVDTFPHPVTRIDAPGVLGMPALTIEKVLVKDGDLVEPGQVLVEFDSSVFQHDLSVAEQKLKDAVWKVELAHLQREDYPLKVKQQKLVVEAAEKKLAAAIKLRNNGSELFEKVLEESTNFTTKQKLTPEEKDRKRKENKELIEADTAVELLNKALEKEQNDLKRLETTRTDGNGQRLTPADIDYQRALTEVDGVRASIAKAKAMIEAFKLRAQVAGTVELVKASPGATFGPTTREPLLYLIPAGKLVVRTEVVAEHAHKIESFRGKTVTVCDAHNTNLTYPGTVLRRPTAFLPKRFGGDALVANPSRVLECTVEVTDPAPAGKTPLRPGQEVRVVFGQ